MQTAQFDLHAQIEQSHWWFLARRRIMRRLVREVLPPGRGSVVVDVGCGTGANLAELAGEYECVGIDTSADAIERARQRFPGVQFIQGFAPDDLGEIAARTRLFTLMDVLEHVPDDFALLSELLAAASPGARFLITVPADESLWSPHDEAFGHYRRYDRQRLERVWGGLPVTPLLVSYFNARLYPLVKMVRGVNRRLGRSCGDAGTDFDIPRPLVNRSLEGVFAGEADVLVDLLRGERTRGYRWGVSLVAVLRREEGSLCPRTRPADVAADLHVPDAAAALV